MLRETSLSSARSVATSWWTTSGTRAGLRARPKTPVRPDAAHPRRLAPPSGSTCGRTPSCPPAAPSIHGWTTPDGPDLLDGPLISAGGVEGGQRLRDGRAADAVDRHVGRARQQVEEPALI